MNITLDIAQPDWLAEFLRSPIPDDQLRRLRRAFADGQPLIDFHQLRGVEGDCVRITAMPRPSRLMIAIAPGVLDYLMAARDPGEGQA